MIWVISGALALVGLVFLTVAAAKLLNGVRELKIGVDRAKERLAQAGELQERLNATVAEVQRAAESASRK